MAGGEVLAETPKRMARGISNILPPFGGKRIALTAGGSPDYYAEDLLGCSSPIRFARHQGILSVLRKLFGLGLQDDSSTGERCSQTT
jgi:hypothetical protein